MSKVRIVDIAKFAGVSPGTVDRYLHKRGRVSQKATEKIRKALEILDYQPNLVARSLSSKRTFKIAVIVPQYDKDAFWQEQVKGMKRAIRFVKDFGVAVDIYSFDDQSSGALMGLSEKITSSGYMAVVIAPTSRKEAKLFFAGCEAHNLPYIQINSYIERKNENFLGYVGQDSFASGGLAAKLLDISTPDNAIFLLLHLEKDLDNSEHMIAKEKGFKDYFDKKQDREIIVEWFPEYDNSALLEKRIATILKKKKDIKGIFVTTSRINHLAMVLSNLKELNIALVGFDLVEANIDFLSRFKRMFLINQNPSLQGYYSLIQIFNHFIKKQEIIRKMYLPLDIITHENAQNYSHINYRDNDKLL